MAPPPRHSRQQRIMAPVVVSVRCSGFLANGDFCNKLLAQVDVDLWESHILAGKQQIKCPKCGKIEDFAKWD